MTYAATRPERVSKLILWCAAPNGVVAPRIEALRPFAHDDWEMYVDLVVFLGFGWEGGQIAKQYAEAIRDNFTAAEWLATLDAAEAFDATPLLEQVQCPTLVRDR